MGLSGYHGIVRCRWDCQVTMGLSGDKTSEETGIFSGSFSFRLLKLSSYPSVD